MLADGLGNREIGGEKKLRPDREDLICSQTASATVMLTAGDVMASSCGCLGNEKRRGRCCRPDA